MLHVALLEPEIPPNTGNIARLCAGTGTRLHLIGPLGFSLTDKYLRRAGLDYWPLVDLHLHATWAEFLAALPTPHRVWLVENPAPRRIYDCEFLDGDVFVFGKESAGLPVELQRLYPARVIDVPVQPNTVRSYNLSTTVGIVVAEAYRQIGWPTTAGAG